MHNKRAGVLVEKMTNSYVFNYDKDYAGPAISLTMPLSKEEYAFDGFPPFFDGLLPEGVRLEGLMKKYKIDKHDYFRQLVTIGEDLVGAVSVFELEND